MKASEQLLYACVFFMSVGYLGGYIVAYWAPSQAWGSAVIVFGLACGAFGVLCGAWFSESEHEEVDEDEEEEEEEFLQRWVRREFDGPETSEKLEKDE